MPKFTVATSAIVFVNVEAGSPQEAAAQWQAWRDRNAILKPSVGVSVLQTLDLHPQLFAPGGKAIGFVVRKRSCPREVRVVEALPMLEKEAKERLKTNVGGQHVGLPPEIIPEAGEEGEAREHAAKLFNTNPRYIQDAKLLKARNPELTREVTRCPRL